MEVRNDGSEFAEDATKLDVGFWLRIARDPEERVNRLGLAAPGASLRVHVEASNDGVHYQRITG